MGKTFLDADARHILSEVRKRLRAEGRATATMSDAVRELRALASLAERLAPQPYKGR